MDPIVCGRCGTEYSEEDFLKTHSEEALRVARVTTLTNCDNCPTHELHKGRPV